MIIKESGEDYLEAILVIKNKAGFVRSIDVANELEVSKPSVSVAMKHFREEGYVVVDKDGYLDLTDKGLAIAKRVYERHEIISEVLMRLGVSQEVALEDSCKIEHAISEESFEKIKEFLVRLKKED
ncbi:MAG: metal-dependent transcriptional regulator [Clostridia bacterium]|nr:metal-dependent transcriptional regulator [Clostridia bacterium]